MFRAPLGKVVAGAPVVRFLLSVIVSAGLLFPSLEVTAQVRSSAIRLPISYTQLEIPSALGAPSPDLRAPAGPSASSEATRLENPYIFSENSAALRGLCGKTFSKPVSFSVSGHPGEHSPSSDIGSQSAQKQDQPIKLKATLVQVPVVATDSAGGRYVTDLRKDDFEIYENGVKQEIELFATTEIPFTVALLLDSSGSTMDQLNEIKSAALAFIDHLKPVDRVMVISFDDSVHVECEFTSDREVLRRAVEAVQPGQFTQVYEAVYTAVWERLKNVDGRKAAIVFTDGIDTASSEISEDDTLDAIADTGGLIVYPIRYSTREDVERRLAARKDNPRNPSRPALSPEERRVALDRTYEEADDYLDQMADLSGGVVERADTLKDLSGAFGRIAEELRKQYLLGYYPSDGADNGSERKISVRVSRPGVKLRARPAYRAPD